VKRQAGPSARPRPARERRCCKVLSKSLNRAVAQTHGSILGALVVRRLQLLELPHQVVHVPARGLERLDAHGCDPAATAGSKRYELKLAQCDREASGEILCEAKLWRAEHLGGEFGM